jgi:ABC-type branched-subunit amino acid transport system ATPase component
VRARTGTITGLIGPNGAGKTTLFNVCSGIVAPASGAVRMGTVSLSHKGPAARARLGIGRTFQQVQLAESLSVQGNVRLGVEAGLVGANPMRQLVAPSGDRRLVTERAAAAIELCGITSIADEPVRSLPTGQRRLVELARALSGSYSILLLDEPSSGLDHAETEAFGQILRHVQAERGTGIVLVEHDMSLVMDICDYIYVLDFGELIFEGSPADVRSSPIVQAAYLGDPKSQVEGRTRA